MGWHIPLKPISISLTLISTLLFFLLFPPNPNPNPNSRRHLLEEEDEEASSMSCSSILSLPQSNRCHFSLSRCPSSSLLNYLSLHFCHGFPLLLPLLLLLQFRILSFSASAHFTPVVSRLSSLLRLSPSMAAVTLLALGNGAPDAFASIAALRSSPGLPLAALLSAGAFVSAFVVGLVAILAGPFPLDPAPFLRDVFFYLLAASALFYVYLSAEIYLWQAVGFVAFYAFFVGLVFWMDLGGRGSDGGKRKGDEEEVELEEGRSFVKNSETEIASGGGGGGTSSLWVFARVYSTQCSTLLIFNCRLCYIEG